MVRQSRVGKSVLHISKLLQCNSTYLSLAPLLFRMLVSMCGLCAEKDCKTCGNIKGLMVINNTRFSFELDTNIEFLCVS